MEVQLKFIEIYPPISDLKKDSDTLTISILTDNNPQVLDIQKVINEQSTISFLTNDKQIKFSINNNNNTLGNVEYTLGNETRWLTVNSTMNKKKGDNFTLNLIDCMRLKIRCSFNDNNPQFQENNAAKKANQTRGGSSCKGQITKKHTSSSCNTKSAKPNKKSVNHFSQIKQGDSKKVNTKLRYNKSYEDGFDSNNLFLTESSPRKHNASFNKKTNSYVLTRNNHKGLHSTKHQTSSVRSMIQKTIGNARNNSYENVSQHHRTEVNHHSKSKRAKQGFKTLDNMVIGKNYESYTRRDGMNSRKNDKNTLFRINLEAEKNKNEDINPKEQDVKEVSFELSTNQFEDEVESSNFLNSKEDFKMLYTNEYFKTIPLEILRLEAQVVVENICDLQDAYHKELILGLNKYSKYKKLFGNYSEKYLLINKEHLKLKDEQERAQVMNTFNTFINNHKLKHTQEILSINKKEICLWNNMPFYSPYTKAKTAFVEKKQEKNKNLIQALAKTIIQKNKSLISNLHKTWFAEYTNKYSRTKSVAESNINKIVPTNNINQKANCKIIQGPNYATERNLHKNN